MEWAYMKLKDEVSTILRNVRNYWPSDPALPEHSAFLLLECSSVLEHSVHRLMNTSSRDPRICVPNG